VTESINTFSAAVLARVEPFFANAIVSWQAVHGRHGLPWQDTRDPYRVWLSEVMLQQTQVATVVGYYARFLECFPTADALADAELDTVLGLWSGLGYYSRARNLHRCAIDVATLYGGRFPSTSEKLQTLPGIGPSTAAAIASFCFGERVAILDGNVKRVLTRVLGFSGDMTENRHVAALWKTANRLLPTKHLDESMPRYTQGLMDVGATVCTRRKPRCDLCPVKALCQGFAEGSPEKYPVKTKKLRRGSERLSLLWAKRPDGSVWLERRHPTGIWGGLYCLPVFESTQALKRSVPEHLVEGAEAMLPFVHTLTHKDLRLEPVIVRFGQTDEISPPSNAMISHSGGWFALDAWSALGLPAPIRKLLQHDVDAQQAFSFNEAHPVLDGA
jgi:A/G-specific adenine glycosylase